VEEGAFAASGGAAEGDGLGGKGLEVDAVQDGDGAVFVALPEVFGAQDGGEGLRERGIRREL